MKCEKCGAKLKKGMVLCPYCTAPVAPKEQTEEPKKKLSRLQLTALILAGALLLGIVVGAILYGLGIIDFNRSNDILYKKKYTVSDRKALRKADLIVATVGDQSLTNEQLQMYYTMEIAEFFDTYGSYLSSVGLDHTKPLYEQYISEEETMTWEHMFLANALSDWYTYAIVRQLVITEQYPISKELQKTLDSLPEMLQELATEGKYSSAAEMIKTDFGPVCTEKAYLAYLEDYYIVMDFLNSKYEQMVPTQEEMDSYFEENKATFEASGVKKDGSKYVSVRHILIAPKGGATGDDGKLTYSEEAWETCHAEAQRILDEWLAGDATEDSFAELANKYSEDTGSNTNGGLYTQVEKDYMVEEFDAWIFDEGREKGNYGLVKTELGYHIMYFVGIEDIWLYHTRTTMVQERIDAMMKDAQSRWPLEVTYRKIFLGNVALIG